MDALCVATEFRLYHLREICGVRRIVVEGSTPTALCQGRLPCWLSAPEDFYPAPFLSQIKTLFLSLYLALLMFYQAKKLKQERTGYFRILRVSSIQPECPIS